MQTKDRKLKDASVLNIQAEPQRTDSAKKYEEVDLQGKGELIKVGANLNEETKQEILSFISEFPDIFAFNVAEMPGIPKKVVCHKLDIRPGYKPIKQKLRHQGKERVEAAKAKVQKLLKANYFYSGMPIF